MAYAGETYAKKLARLSTWESVRETMGPRFLKEYHVCLASEEAGDVSTLIGMGVPASLIVACDTDLEAVRSATHKFEHVSVRHASVVDVAATMSKRGLRVGSVFLDFCGPVGRTTFDIANSVSAHIRNGGVLAINVLRGRDRSSDDGVVRLPNSRRNRRKYLVKATTPDCETIMRCMRDEFDPRPIYECFRERDASMRRAMAWMFTLTAAWGFRRGFGLRKVIGYFGHGVPMTTSVLQVSTVPRSAAGMFERSNWVVDSIPEECEALEAVRTKAVSMDAATAGLIYNIPRARVSAWKAHATMGTYTRVAA